MPCPKWDDIDESMDKKNWSLYWQLRFVNLTDVQNAQADNYIHIHENRRNILNILAGYLKSIKFTTNKRISGNFDDIALVRSTIPYKYSNDREIFKYVNNK